MNPRKIVQTIEKMIKEQKCQPMVKYELDSTDDYEKVLRLVTSPLVDEGVEKPSIYLIETEDKSDNYNVQDIKLFIGDKFVLHAVNDRNDKARIILYELVHDLVGIHLGLSVKCFAEMFKKLEQIIMIANVCLTKYQDHYRVALILHNVIITELGCIYVQELENNYRVIICLKPFAKVINEIYRVLTKSPFIYTTNEAKVYSKIAEHFIERSLENAKAETKI